MNSCASAAMSEQALAHVPASPFQGPGHQTALHRAAMMGNTDGMAALIQGGCAVDLQDRDGNTALHEVSWHGFSHCVKLLVKAGADVHIRNKMGDTCLHVAARYNNLTLVKILLCSQCSMTRRNQAGDTALHVAAALNHKKTVQLLLEAGTDGNIRNNAGKTALDRARDNNHKEVAHLLTRAPQVQCFMRGRTIKKQRERLQSVTRVEITPNKDSVRECPEQDSNSVMGESPSSEQMQQHHHKTLAATNSHRKGRVKEQVLNKNAGESDFHVKKNLLWDDGEDSVENGKIYQLYTLYRDKDGNIRQAPANGCHCKPLLKKMESQLRATQEEMRLHILNVQEQVNSQLVKMDHRNRHQIKVLDMLNQERAAAERRKMVYEMEQRAARGREEALITQTAVGHELKRWCMSHLKDMDIHVPAKAHYYQLLQPQSVEQSVADGDLESLPLLSVVSGESSTSLATYVNILPSKSTCSLGGPEQQQMGSRTYFEMKVDRSPDDYENMRTTLFPLPAKHTSGLLLGPVDAPLGASSLQHSPMTSGMPLCGESFSSSSSQSSISTQGPRLIQQEHNYDTQDKKCVGGLMSAHRYTGICTEGTRTLEFFIGHPTEPTFSQERKNQHAIEVTQRFFETVSTQLERWYERKIVEVEQQTELRAQQDRKELLQQISSLEEELQRLKTNENTES